MAIWGIRFHSHGQTQYYSGPDVIGSIARVLIEEDGALMIADVISGPHAALQGVSEEQLPCIARVADDADLVAAEENDRLVRDATAFCRRCIDDRHLDMKLVDVEVFFDRSKLTFYFTAPARIDFRELIKDLVRRYHIRIELRQIGVRHETQMVGTVGNCGMVCCCRRYLRKFAPVTIRMAKEQNLFLNPAKISGSCGRLLCCLAYEQDNYENFYCRCPKLGKKYQTVKGDMKVLRANMFRNAVAVVNENGEEQELTLEEWQALSPTRAEQRQAAAATRKNGPLVQNELLVISASPDGIEEKESGTLQDILAETPQREDAGYSAAGHDEELPRNQRKHRRRNGPK
ncbi:MAG: hypothetical protein K6F46_11335 [Desulfovibrio sp.]|nr:hypothetical protein [Desulfovibrio sp.]